MELRLQNIIPVPVRRWLGAKSESARFDPVAENHPFDDLQQRAREGDVEAKYELARHFLAEGPRQHMACGLDWLDRAAAGGHVEALAELGQVYARGTHRPRDNRKALQHYKCAAQSGHAGALYTLGSAFELGQLGLVANHASARRLYVKAVLSGHAPSAYRLGLLYQHGQGVRPSLVNAVLWFTIAARLKHTAARAARARLSRQLSDAQKARICDHLERWDQARNTGG